MGVEGFNAQGWMVPQDLTGDSRSDSLKSGQGCRCGGSVLANGCGFRLQYTHALKICCAGFDPPLPISTIG